MTDPVLPTVAYRYPPALLAGPRLALVGEAPGAEEVRLGQPFVGRSGQLLDRALAAAGIDRGACLVANTFRCQPPGNRVGHFFASRARARREGLAVAEALGAFGASDYCLAAFAGEVAALAQALADYRPAVIVALGRTPLWALTGLSGILKLRGQVLPCTLMGPDATGVRVVPTFHPSYLLRGRRDAEGTFIDDLKLARSLLN